MDIKQLYYFLTICEEGQITAAARRLHMAQPPLSYQLKSLEAELGVELIKRGRHKIQLTDAGILLQERARQIMQLMDGTRKEVLDAGKTVSHHLTIGIVTSAHAAFLQTGIQQFHRDYPQVSYILKEGNTFQVLEMLERGTIEIGIVRTPFPQTQVHAIPILQEGMVAAAHKSIDPFIKQTITLEDLKNHRLTYYERYATLLQELFLEKGIYMQPFCLNQDARTTLLWAKKELGIAIVPASACTLIDAQELHLHPILEKRLQTSIMMITKKDRYLSDVATSFLQYYLSSNTNTIKKNT